MEKNLMQQKAELLKKLNHLYQAPSVSEDLRKEVNLELENLVKKLKQAI